MAPNSLRVRVGGSEALLRNLIDGLTVLGNPQALAYLFGGSIVGMLLGVVPGVGGLIVLSILLSFLYHISLTGAICLFLASYAASFFSASVTSILLNTPAHPESFAVSFDGFPMAQRGEAGKALGISASSTCIGGIVGCACLVGFIQIINYLPGIFHPPEYVALITIALLLVGTLGTDAASKALISAGIGLMIACVGSDPISGELRFTFGSVGLLGGLSLVALALGLFAVPQMVLIFGTATTISKQDMLGNEIGEAAPVELEKGFGKQVIEGIRESFRHWVTLIGSGLIGVVTGIIPGIGGFAANFLSYGIAQQLSPRRELFGTGIAEGIIAPEGSSLSKEAGSMVPIIGLGIPGGVGGALFLAALTIKGVKVGQGLTTQYPSLPYEIMWVICLGGIIGTVAGLLCAPFLARVTKVPGPLLVSVIVSLAVVGPFVAEDSFFTVMEVVAFAIIGLLLRRLRYSLASFAIGLVLGPTLESNISLTRGAFTGWTFLERPLADTLFAIGIVVLVLKTIQMRRDAKKAVAVADEAADPIERAAQLRRRHEHDHPYPFLAVICSAAIAASMIALTVYAAVSYTLTTALLPCIAGVAAGGGALWRLPFEIRGYVVYRRYKREDRVAHAAPLPQPVTVGGGIGALHLEPSRGGGLGLAVTEASLTGELFEDLEGATSPALPRTSLAPIQDKSWGLHGQYTREVVGFCWFIVCVVSCWLFDFEVGIPLFVGLYGLVATRRVFSRVYKRAVFAFITAAVMWFVTFEMINLTHLTFTPVVHIF